MSDTAEKVYPGIGVGRGAVIGPVVVISDADPATDLEAQSALLGLSPEEGAARVADAFDAVIAFLKNQAEAADGDLAAVLNATAAIAADPALAAEVKRRVGAGEEPVAAINAAVDGFITLFESIGGMMAERVTDLVSVRDRVLATLLGTNMPGHVVLDEPSIVVARDLAPADTATLDLSKVLAIVTELGGATSHTAIIAGQLGLPAVVRVANILAIEPGSVVAVDAARGVVVAAPGEQTRAQVAARAEFEHRLSADSSPGSTADGRPVDLLANIGTPEDAERAAETSDAKRVSGSGLFRTEILFLDAQQAPSRADQAASYARVLAAFGDRKVVVRTLDAGADKPLAFATLADEENPALGVRGYRVRRQHPELLDVQLAALAEAAELSGTDPWVMAPMIATSAEAAEFAALARSHGLNRVGVMVEVPAAALRAEAILREVDFVSIGTNDLSQYTMAADRLQGELSDLLDAWQPAVLELIQRTAAAGMKLGKPVGVCGEAAADPILALVLVGFGVTSLSMATGAVPEVRYALSQHTFAQCQAIAEAAVSAADPVEARARVAELLDPEVRVALA